MSAPSYAFRVRPDWLALQDEEILEPAQPIVDSHQHLYVRPEIRYLLDDYLADVSTGHDVRASVFVQARAMLRRDGPPELRPVGEVEFVNGVAAMSASGAFGVTRVCAGIVGQADLMLGEAVRLVLERLILAGGGLVTNGGRFCGIRHILAWDPDTSLLNPAYPTFKHMMGAAAFRAGFAQLEPLGLSFDAWAFFSQLGEMAQLARAFPDTQIVVNHCGGLTRAGAYAGQADVYDRWKAGITDLAGCPNVMLKLSGLGMPFCGFGFNGLPRAPGSADLAKAWRPLIEHCIDAFGPSRCMSGSNFPVDKSSYNFKTGMNALKRLTSGASQTEKDDIFWRSAQRFYRLPMAALGMSDAAAA